MRFILLIITIAQLQQYAASVSFIHKAGSRFPPKFKVAGGIYELRRISDDEIGSVKPDRIVTVDQDQSMLKGSGGIRSGYQALKRYQIPESDGQGYVSGQSGYQSEVVSVSGADGKLNYMQARAVSQNSEPIMVGSALSKHDYMQAQRGYQPMGMAQATQQNDSPSELPGGQHYMQGGQQDYHVVNENSNEAVSISLPGYQAVGNAQNYLNSLRQPQQVPDGYQVVNEGPAAHVVNMPEAASYPVLPESGPHYAQTQNEAHQPYDGSYIPQNQQPEMQYDMRNTQQAPMKIPLSYLSGAEGMQQQGQLWNMIRNSRTASNDSPSRSHAEPPKPSPK